MYNESVIGLQARGVKTTMPVDIYAERKNMYAQLAITMLLYQLALIFRITTSLFLE